MINQVLGVMEPFQAHPFVRASVRSQPRKASEEKQTKRLGSPAEFWHPGLLAPGTRRLPLGLSRPRPVLAPGAAPLLLRPPQPRPLPTAPPVGTSSARGRRPVACAPRGRPQPPLSIYANRRRRASLSRSIRMLGQPSLLLRPRDREGGKSLSAS